MDPHSFIARAEAQRWLGIAEKLLMSNDLVGSKTFAIRARESDPRLEAAEQILAVADTLLAAEKRVVGNNGAQQPDFYAILQLARFVQDTDHIAAQYRRLAVLLNPHQNRFPYSDQAFQLVNDAWAVFSNPMRKSMYDSELDFPPQQQMNSIGFNLEQQHHHQQHHQQQQQQQHNFFSINHMGSGHERELSEPPQTFQTRVQQSHQHQQLQQHNFLSQPNPIRPVPVREQEDLFQQREQEQLFQPQVQPFQITSTPQQQTRPTPQPPQPQPPMQPPPPPPPAALPQPPSTWPQAPPLSQPQQQKHLQPQAQSQKELQQQLQQKQRQQQLKQEQQQLQHEQHQLQQKKQREQQQQQQQLQEKQRQQQLQQEQQQQQQQLQEKQRQQQLQQEQQQLQEKQRQQQLQQEQRQQQEQLQEKQRQQQLQQEQQQQEQLKEKQRQQQLQQEQQQKLEEKQRQQQLQQEEQRQKQQQQQEKQSLEQNAAPVQLPNQVNSNNGVREEEIERETETEAASEIVDELPTFWTACPFCFYMYEYPRIYADCILRCDNCKRAFQTIPIPSPPPIIEGQEAYFCCWGFFPVGVSMLHLETTNGPRPNTKWTPVTPLYDASSNAQDHLNGRAAPKKNTFVNKSSGPQIYVDDVVDDVTDDLTNDVTHDVTKDATNDVTHDVTKDATNDVGDDVFMGISEPSDDSDDEWNTSTSKKKKVKRKKKGSGDKKRAEGLPVRTSTRNGRIKNLEHGISVQEGVAAPAVPVAESSKKTMGSNPRRQSIRVKKELGKLDLNVEFNNNEGEEPAPGMTGGNRGHGQGEEDNIEGIGFFEGLDEFLSSLPILSVVNDEKGKAA